MHRQVRADRSDEPGGPHVLNKHGVDARLGDGDDHLLEPGPFVAEDQCIERGVAFESAAVERGEKPRQVGEREVRGAGPCVEAGVEAEVDGVGTVFDSGADAVPVTGGREQFWSGGHGGEYTH